jgi:ABC-type phosphate transport system substrate-binding protein
MKKSILKLSLLCAVMAAAGAAFAGDIVVIANAGVTLSPEEVRDVFVGDKQLAGSTKLVPIDNSAAQADFLSKVVKVDAAKYGAIWTKKGFRDGLKTPDVKGSDAEVAAAVKSTPGAVGYVSKAPADAKVIAKY